MRPVIDARADSTVDAAPQTVNAVLDQIKGEELAENEELRASVEAEQQAQLDGERAKLVGGWQQAMQDARDIVASAFPQLGAVWTKDRMDNIGAALARCDEHYGWGGAGKLIGHPLAGLAVASFPVALGTYQWIKLEKERLATQRLANKNAASDAKIVKGDKAATIDAAIAAESIAPA